MNRIGTVQAIYRYPVKSMAGAEVASAFVGYSGLFGDRSYAFVRRGGTAGFPWHTGRDQETLVKYLPTLRSGFDLAAPPDIDASFGMAPGVNPLFPRPPEIDVLTPGGRSLPIDSPDLAEELGQAGAPVELRFSERSLCDCRPVSIFGNETAAGLGRELGVQMDRRRFRANLYVDWSDAGAFREDALVGRTIRIGGRLEVAVTGRDPRCKMITIDPDTAETSPRILRHVASAHEGSAGVYGAVLLEGVVHRGDEIVAL